MGKNVSTNELFRNYFHYIGSYLVTPCALTSCHVVIGKQGNESASR